MSLDSLNDEYFITVQSGFIAMTHLRICKKIVVDQNSLDIGYQKELK